MAKLSLYQTSKNNDYKFFDGVVGETLNVGGTDLLIHKYLSPASQGPSSDYTQPEYASQSVINIEDLLFLENRDRNYAPDIYRLRGHYNVQNLDFDLSQFGLFLNSDIIWIVVHFNTMIDIIGRKLMVGDVLELPHLLDYYPLNEQLQYALKKYYQITDANYASEGFSPTWYPHLWRIKCEPLTNTQEFTQILDAPQNTDNYLGSWNSTTTYPPGYTITFGNTTYQSIASVPAGVTPPNSTYWEVVNSTESSVMSMYNSYLAINDAALKEAKAQVPLSGYDNTMLYVVPTSEDSNNCIVPGLPYDIITTNSNNVTVVANNNPDYRLTSYGIRISPTVLKSLKDQTAAGNVLSQFLAGSMELIAEAPQLTNAGSASVENMVAVIITPSPVTHPYGTADNTFITSDQNPKSPGFTGTVSSNLDYLADCDPRYQYFARSTPSSFGYAAGYMTGDGKAPNGLPTGAGISFPSNPNLGDYFLRTDYMPQILFRWSGKSWIRVSENVRTGLGFDNAANNQSLLSGFINNDNTIYSNNARANIPEAQPLSTILKPKPDNLPPV